MTELRKKWSLAVVWTPLLPAVPGARKEGKPPDHYRNSDHTWACTCISWQKSEVVLEMLLSRGDGMLRTLCLLLDIRAEQYTLPQLESISLRVPNILSIRGQFLTCRTFLPCAEGSLVFVYRFRYQTANSIRSKSTSDYPGTLSCSAHLLIW